MQHILPYMLCPKLYSLVEIATEHIKDQLKAWILKVVNERGLHLDFCFNPSACWPVVRADQTVGPQPSTSPEKKLQTSKLIIQCCCWIWDLTFKSPTRPRTTLQLYSFGGIQPAHFGIANSGNRTLTLTTRVVDCPHRAWGEGVQLRFELSTCWLSSSHCDTH